MVLSNGRNLVVQKSCVRIHGMFIAITRSVDMPLSFHTREFSVYNSTPTRPNSTGRFEMKTVAFARTSPSHNPKNQRPSFAYRMRSVQKRVRFSQKTSDRVLNFSFFTKFVFHKVRFPCVCVCGGGGKPNSAGRTSCEKDNYDRTGAWNRVPRC